MPGLFRLLDMALDLAFPPRCPGCGCVDVDWCLPCHATLLQTPLLPLLRRDVSHVTGVAATGTHTGMLQRAVQALKYQNAPFLAPFLSERLRVRLEELGWQIDDVIPIPLHTKRLQERGYNQSQRLCVALPLPCREDALQRTRHTHAQVGLNQAERMTNLVGAFTANAALVNGRTVLLVDDVCTTGSTLTACAEVLLAAGARAVYGLTVTMARGSI